MKFFHIKDEDGMEYKVEEIEKETTVPTTDNETLSDVEIDSLKKLAAVADKLIALLEVEKEEHDVDEAKEEMLEDEEIEEKEDEDEIVIDTDEVAECESKAHDSKRSIGAIERNQVNDSLEVQDEIANAWNLRYNGGNK